MIAAWLTEKLGIYGARIAAVGGVILAVLLAALKLFSLGKQAERGAEAAREVEAVKQKLEVEREASNASDAALDDANSKWLR